MLSAVAASAPCLTISADIASAQSKVKALPDYFL